LDPITTDTDLIIQSLFYEADSDPILAQNKGSGETTCIIRISEKLA
jgi:hypothetical protein